MHSKKRKPAQHRTDNATSQRRKRTKSPLQPRRKWTEAELLKGVTPGSVAGEINWGPPRGREM